MAKKKFYYSFDDVADLNASGLLTFISKCNKEKLGNISILDLAYFGGLPTNGVYVFYNSDGEVIYVGKCASRCFVERIPSHFDVRGTDNWFGTLIKGYSERFGVSRERAVQISDAFSIVLICCDRCLNINEVERHMQYVLKPCLNRVRKVFAINPKTTLAEVAVTPKPEGSKAIKVGGK